MIPSDSPNANHSLRRVCLWFVGVMALAMVACGIYVPTLTYDMIFDDLMSIVRNDSIHSLTPLFGTPDGYGPLKPQPETPVTARPLVSLTFALSYYFSQQDPWGYRLTHIIAHLLVALIVWAVVSSTLGQPVFRGRFLNNRYWLGFVAAMIWMVHPVNTETIVYLTQRTELQMGLFYALTLYLSIHFWRSHRIATRLILCVGAGLASVCGMLSKEMMASVPAMVFFYEWTFIGGSVWMIFKRSWMLYAALILSWLPLAGIYLSGIGTPAAGFHTAMSAHDFWLTQSNSFFVYWRLLFVPWPLIVHYHVPTLSSFSAAWPSVLGLSLYLVFTAICVWRRKATGFALLWFFAVLSPTLIVPLPHEEISERRLYVPLMAMIPFLVVGGYTLVHSLMQRRMQSAQAEGLVQSETTKGTTLIFLTPIVAITTAFVWLCIVSLPRLQHRAELWSHVLKHQPDNTFAIASQGIEDCQRGEFKIGLEKIQIAYDSEPTYFFFSASLLQTLDYMQEHERMLVVSRQLYDLFPNDAARTHTLAASLEKNGMFDEAIEKYREAVELSPSTWEAHSALATLLAERNRNEEALPHFEMSTELHPDFMNCMNLMTVYLNLQQPQKALAVGKLLLEAARKEKSLEEAEQIELALQQMEHEIAALSPR